MRNTIHYKKRFQITGITDYIFTGCEQESSILLIINNEQVLCMVLSQMLIESFIFTSHFPLLSFPCGA